MGPVYLDEEHSDTSLDVHEASHDGDEPTMEMYDLEEESERRIEYGAVFEDRYRVERFIGRGGFAEVYEGQQLNIERPVALKVLDLAPGENNAERFHRRFLREAKLAAKVRHPGILTIFDYGIATSGNPYIVTELLNGHTLAEELDMFGAMNPMRAVLLMIRCLDSLQAAHRLDIVHRDLKPSNLFLVDPRRRSERLCVLDFGLAAINDGASDRITQAGQIHGTPQYLSPEYIEEQILTPALDVYQMGLILVEMLTGLPVVNNINTYDCFLRHTRGELDIPEWLLEGPLGVVLERALHLDHQVRFPNGEEFGRALESILPELDFQLTPLDSAEIVAFTRPQRVDTPSLPAMIAPQGPRRVHRTPVSSTTVFFGGEDAASRDASKVEESDVATMVEVTPPHSRTPWLKIVVFVLLAVAGLLLAIFGLGASAGDSDAGRARGVVDVPPTSDAAAEASPLAEEEVERDQVPVPDVEPRLEVGVAPSVVAPLEDEAQPPAEGHRPTVDEDRAHPGRARSGRAVMPASPPPKLDFFE